MGIYIYIYTLTTEEMVCLSSLCWMLNIISLAPLVAMIDP